MTDSITPAPQFSPPTSTAPSIPVVVTLEMASVPVPRLWDMRRDLISALQTVETLLCLPPEKRAIRNREERRGNGGSSIMNAGERSAE